MSGERFSIHNTDKFEGVPCTQVAREQRMREVAVKLLSDSLDGSVKKFVDGQAKEHRGKNVDAIMRQLWD